MRHRRTIITRVEKKKRGEGGERESPTAKIMRGRLSFAARQVNWKLPVVFHPRQGRKKIAPNAYLQAEKRVFRIPCISSLPALRFFLPPPSLPRVRRYHTHSFFPPLFFFKQRPSIRVPLFLFFFLSLSRKENGMKKRRKNRGG